ncbi:MAG TPA: cell division protein ZapA [Firmicutes bacterium]|jgi:cell division protein ZapA|nr:cell division protein ZapA [Bacillota bacterium]
MTEEREKKRVTINILGEKYIIRSPSSHKHIFEVEGHVNALMKELTEKYPRLSLQKIAILASLNLASDLLSLKKEKRRKR